MNQQLVAGVEGSVAPLTRRPEAGEVVALALVDVRLLDVSGKRLSAGEDGVAVHPAALSGSVLLPRATRTALLLALMLWLLLCCLWVVMVMVGR